MPKKPNLADLKMIETLALYSPRNMTEISRKLQLPAETLRKKVKRLYSQTFLRFNINVQHATLGLRKAIVLAEAIPGYEATLLEALKINDFWISVSRCYGMFDGCVGIFAIPFESCDLFEHFVDEVKRVSLARNTQIFWSDYFHSVHLRSNWFDQKTENWNFNWEEWIKETKKANPSPSLLEPVSFHVQADKIDILILKELEKDARISFKRLAEKIGISPQLTRYHYYGHVIRGGFLKDFEVGFLHFGENSLFSFFIFSFDKLEKLEKFASSLKDKPFAKALGKISDKNQLYGYLYLPKSEFRNFLDALSELVRSGFLETYEYAIQDLANSSRATIPFQCFKDGKWIYEHERYIHILQRYLEEKSLADKRLALKSIQGIRT
jgi:DNA-binding Lrp family transcriptional regulator